MKKLDTLFKMMSDYPFWGWFALFGFGTILFLIILTFVFRKKIIFVRRSMVVKKRKNFILSNGISADEEEFYRDEEGGQERLQTA